MNSIKIKENCHWVGAIDWDLRNFHGYLTQRGSSYNSYLLIDEKITLIDMVKPGSTQEMLARISSIVNPERIDYIVSNHVEMDHSGSLPEIMKIAKNAVIVTSPNGKKGLCAHYGENDWNFRVVKSGDELSIGKKTLQFLLTPMVHWPDSMVCYLKEESILFSNDAFGQHIASSERFDDEYSKEIILNEAKKYYANIVLLYSSQVKKVLQTLSGFNIEIIAPSHGCIWRSYISSIIGEYQKWSENLAENKGIIVYDSMWGSTKKIAHAIQEAFESQGVNIKIIHLQKNHISDIMTDVLTTKYICIGSSTLNNNMLPTVAGFMSYLKGLSPKERIGMAFGSYGWGGQSIEHIKQGLTDCGFSLMDSIKAQYVPNDNVLSEITRNVKNNIEKINL